jgi:hypothetical protein
MSYYHNLIQTGPSYEPEAIAFFVANNTLTDVTTKDAINQFYVNLKFYGIYSLGEYFYLGFLGDSTKVKYNVFDPSNQLIFSSGWTFDAYGMQGNGTSAYAQTGFISSASAVQDSKTLFVYSQTDSDQLGAEIGCYAGVLGDIFLPKYSGNCYFALSHPQWQTIANSGTTKGLQLITRTAPNVSKLYNKSSLVGTNSSISTGQSSVQDFLGAFNNGGPQWYSSRKISVYGRMAGLDATQEANLKTCIETLLTSLSIPTW